MRPLMVPDHTVASSGSFHADTTCSLSSNSVAAIGSLPRSDWPRYRAAILDQERHPKPAVLHEWDQRPSALREVLQSGQTLAGWPRWRIAEPVIKTNDTSCSQPRLQ